MLPASRTDVGPLREEARRDSRIALVLALALLAYVLLVVWGVLAQRIATDRAYIWMALACLPPCVWYGYGFVKTSGAEQDLGLLLSALGWALAALALLLKYGAVRAALETANPAAQRSLAVTLCTIFSLVCLGLGAILSLHAWSQDNG